MWTNLQILAGLFTFITVIFRKAPLFAKWKLINIHLKSDHLRSYFWSEYRKIRTRNNSVFRHFSRSDLLCFVHILFEIFCVTYHWSANLFADGTFWSIMPVISCFRLKLTSQPDKFFAFMLICFCRLPILKMLSSVVKMLFVELAFFCEFYQ